DDRSRVCCHAQWYIGDEDTESFVHGLCQGFQKRGLPRALLSDNGSPMIAAETREGLERLSVEHHTTLSQTPEQNGKQEVFWAQVEGRLMAMLEGEPALALALLTGATQPWRGPEDHTSPRSFPSTRSATPIAVAARLPIQVQARALSRLPRRRASRPSFASRWPTTPPRGCPPLTSRTTPASPTTPMTIRSSNHEC